MAMAGRLGSGERGVGMVERQLFTQLADDGVAQVLRGEDFGIGSPLADPGFELERAAHLQTGYAAGSRAGVFALSRAFHPHGRGDGGETTERLFAPYGSPPRAWGSTA